MDAKALMDSIIRGTVVRPRKMMFFGSDGVGKTTLASESWNPIFVKTEDGTNDLDTTSFPKSESFADVMQVLSALLTEDHDRKTVVIDSADGLQTLVFAETCRRHNVPSIESFGYGKGFTFALDVLREIIAILDKLQDERGMMVIIIAHAKVETMEDPRLSETYQRYSPNLHRSCSSVWREWVDEVLFLAYKVETVKTKEGFNRIRVTGAGEGGRIIYCEARPAFTAKNRMGLPSEIPFHVHQSDPKHPQRCADPCGKITGWETLSSYFPKPKNTAKKKAAKVEV